MLLSSALDVQEVAGNHGVAIWGRTEGGFAADPIMVEQSLIFVATRIQLQLSEYPRWYASAVDLCCILLLDKLHAVGLPSVARFSPKGVNKCYK